MDLPESAGLNDKFWHRLFEWLNVRFPLTADLWLSQNVCPVPEADITYN